MNTENDDLDEFTTENNKEFDNTKDKLKQEQHEEQQKNHKMIL